MCALSIILCLLCQSVIVSRGDHQIDDKIGDSINRRETKKISRPTKTPNERLTINRTQSTLHSSPVDTVGLETVHRIKRELDGPPAPPTPAPASTTPKHKADKETSHDRKTKKNIKGDKKNKKTEDDDDDEKDDEKGKKYKKLANNDKKKKTKSSEDDDNDKKKKNKTGGKTKKEKENDDDDDDEWKRRRRKKKMLQKKFEERALKKVMMKQHVMVERRLIKQLMIQNAHLRRLASSVTQVAVIPAANPSQIALTEAFNQKLNITITQPTTFASSVPASPSSPSANTTAKSVAHMEKGDSKKKKKKNRKSDKDNHKRKNRQSDYKSKKKKKKRKKKQKKKKKNMKRRDDDDGKNQKKNRHNDNDDKKQRSRKDDDDNYERKIRSRKKKKKLEKKFEERALKKVKKKQHMMAERRRIKQLMIQNAKLRKQASSASKGAIAQAEKHSQIAGAEISNQTQNVTQSALQLPPVENVRPGTLNRVKREPNVPPTQTTAPYIVIPSKSSDRATVVLPKSADPNKLKDIAKHLIANATKTQSTNSKSNTQNSGRLSQNDLGKAIPKLLKEAIGIDGQRYNYSVIITYKNGTNDKGAAPPSKIECANGETLDGEKIAGASACLVKEQHSNSKFNDKMGEYDLKKDAVKHELATYFKRTDTNKNMENDKTKITRPKSKNRISHNSDKEKKHGKQTTKIEKHHTRTGSHGTKTKHKDVTNGSHSVKVKHSEATASTIPNKETQVQSKLEEKYHAGRMSSAECSERFKLADDKELFLLYLHHTGNTKCLNQLKIKYNFRYRLITLLAIVISILVLAFFMEVFIPCCFWCLCGKDIGCGYDGCKRCCGRCCVEKSCRDCWQPYAAGGRPWISACCGSNCEGCPFCSEYCCPSCFGTKTYNITSARNRNNTDNVHQRQPTRENCRGKTTGKRYKRLPDGKYKLSRKGKFKRMKNGKYERVKLSQDHSNDKGSSGCCGCIKKCFESNKQSIAEKGGGLAGTVTGEGCIAACCLAIGELTS